ncbi:MAG: hypothetical protein AB1467_04670 [Candidatus Diapherotrites archaeon]
MNGKSGRRKLIVLHGGLKPRKIEGIERKKYLGSGVEGKVFEVEVAVKKAKKIKKRVFAEKEFREGMQWYGHWLPPKKQWLLMKELLKLNRDKKLGLRIIPTIRPLKRKDKISSFFLTKLDVIDFKGINSKKLTEFEEDMQRQIEIGSKKGYFISDDAFLPVFDKKTKKVIAIIGDFGQIRRKEDFS